MTSMDDLVEKSISINKGTSIVAVYHNDKEDSYRVSSYMYADSKRSTDRFINSYNEEEREHNNILLRAYLYVDEDQEKIIRKIVEENKFKEPEDLKKTLDSNIDEIINVT